MHVTGRGGAAGFIAGCRGRDLVRYTGQLVNMHSGNTLVEFH